jgi:trehalose 6-phosphate phosphatase
MAGRPGVRLEIKGPIVALHYRSAPDEEPACLVAAATAARTVPGYVIQAGKMVVEIKPETAHKGAALRRLMTAQPFAGTLSIDRWLRPVCFQNWPEALLPEDLRGI